MAVTEQFDPKVLVGPPSTGTLTMLSTAVPAALGSSDATALAIACEFGKRLLDAIQLRALASAVDKERREKGSLSAPAHELSAATGLHHVTAGCRADLACSVLTRLPTTLKLMEAGKLRLQHAEDIERATRSLTDDQARHVDATAVPPGPRGLAGRIADAIAKLDPGVLEKKAEQVNADRDVTFYTDSLDGTGGINVHGPVDKVAQIKAAIDSLARIKAVDDPRNLGARRFDVLYGWARTILGLPLHDPITGNPAPAPGSTRPGGAPGTPGRPGTPAPGSPPTGSGGGPGDADGPGDGSSGDSAASGPHTPGACSSCGRAGPATIPINVTISAAALLRLSEAPGDLDGSPIPAEVARQLAADGRWRRFVTEPHTGRLLDVGANTYRPTGEMLRFVQGRNRTCIFPNCTRPAHQCDCDHNRTFHGQRGRTVKANLGPLCRAHHRCKHELGWTYHRHPDDTITWTAPSGRKYVTQPERYADDGYLSQHLTAMTRRRRERERKAADTRAKAADPIAWAAAHALDLGDPPF